MPLGVIRPDEWNLPLFLHVLGAMLLVGTLLLAGFVLFWRQGERSTAGLGFRVVLFGVLPAYLLMRVAAEWIYDEEGFGGEDPDWIAIGYIVTDGGAVLLLVTLVLAGIAARRPARPGGGAMLTRVAGAVSYVLLAAYVVAVWAMTAKPGA